MLKAYAKARPKTSALDDSLQDLWHVSLTASDQRAQGNKLTGVSGLPRKRDTLMVPFAGNQVAGRRGGAVYHTIQKCHLEELTLVRLFASAPSIIRTITMLAAWTSIAPEIRKSPGSTPSQWRASSAVRPC